MLLIGSGQRKGWPFIILGFLILALMANLVSCPVINPIPVIKGTFKYESIETTLNIKTEPFSMPIWNNPADWQKENIKYEMAPENGGTVPTGITINSNTGKVSVNLEEEHPPAVYQVMAIGTAPFTGVIRSTIRITVTKPSLSGELHYADIQTFYGVASDSPPLWSNKPAEQTMVYNLTTADGSGIPAGISIDEATGRVSVSVNTQLQNKVHYTIQVIGMDKYTGTIETTIGIAVHDSAITGMLNYDPVRSVYGSAVEVQPLWINDQGGQYIHYSMVPSGGGNLPYGININELTGVITIGATTVIQPETDYSVSALGIDGYTGVIKTTVSIAIAEKGLSGTLYYEDMQPTFGMEMQGNPTWTNATEEQTVRYEMELVGGGTLPITIDEETGVVNIEGTVNAGTYADCKVTAIGTGNFAGILTATFKLEIQQASVSGDLSYNKIQASYSELFDSQPIWANAPASQTLIYTITQQNGNPIPAGISVDENTGTVSTDGTADVQSDTVYIITASGVDNYRGSITANIEIGIIQGPLAGLLSYSDIDTTYGTTEISLPVWELEGNTIQYPSVHYKMETLDGQILPTGITIDENTGEIRLGVNTEVASTDIYKVTATGMGNYTNDVTAFIDIKINAAPLTGTLNYTAIITQYSVPITSPPDWQNAPPGQMISYKLTPITEGNLPTGITIDEKTGYIQVDGTANAQTATDYTVTAQGTVNYYQYITGTISIEITRKPIIGTLSYNPIQTHYGTKVQSDPTWINAITGQSVV